MTCGAVVCLMAGGTAISVYRSLATVIFIPPSENVVLRAHHFVALETRVARVAAQVLVAVLAVGILVGCLLSVIGAKFQVVVFGKG